MRIVITIDGGLVQEVFTDDEKLFTDAELLIVDYDIEGTDPDKIIDNGQGEDAYIHGDNLVLNKGFVDGVFKSLEDANR